MSDHRHTLPGTHEYDQEPQVGLPEQLPPNERLIWQGSPNWRSMAVDVFHVRKIAIYLFLMMAARAYVVAGELGFSEGIVAAIWLTPFIAFAIGGIALLAYLSARDTMYTITSKRVVMRIGIALTLTYNIPLKLIFAAGVHERKDGSGDIPLTLVPGNKIALLNLWPHARPWRFSAPEPMLRCLPDVKIVAAELSKAWAQANQQAAIPTVKITEGNNNSNSPTHPSLVVQ
jgi:Bacterial PH domain